MPLLQFTLQAGKVHSRTHLPTLLITHHLAIMPDSQHRGGHPDAPAPLSAGAGKSLNHRADPRAQLHRLPVGRRLFVLGVWADVQRTASMMGVPYRAVSVPCQTLGG